MALRNAFDNIATEGTLRSLVRALSFAKDSGDRLRVIVDSNITSLVYMNNSSTSLTNNVTPTPHTANTWNVVDARVEIQELSQQNFQMTRNRWTIT